MQSRFYTRHGLYRRDGLVHRPRSAAHLWPFVRAFVATLDLAGVNEVPVNGFDADAAIAARLATLERYWDPAGPGYAYSSDIVRTRSPADRYYDDNAWVGLALIQLERMRPGGGRLERAADLFRFAVAGWDRRTNVPSPGGVFWVEQGRGAGVRNHDRNTVSNAPNAELGLHLAELTGLSAGAPDSVGPEEMYGWVNTTLDAGLDDNSPAAGLFWDKLLGDDTLDQALRSYNQGSMVGANVLLARRGGEAQARYLARAEAIARAALRHYGGRYEEQPPAFNAIFFRNLLLLHAATDDLNLRTQIRQAMQGYADGAWSERRDRRDRFHFSRAGVTLLDQSAMVQVLALLAWNPGDYRRLA
jgi:Glycosyl hydrolase family 76